MGLVAHAAITWWKVGEQGRKIDRLEAVALARMESDIDSLREWRAQAREKLLGIERRLSRHVAEDLDEGNDDEK
jgi:hypothetical protein